MAKSEEERMKNARDAIRRYTDGATDVTAPGFVTDLARYVLEAIDAPPESKWPTDESIDLMKRLGPEGIGSCFINDMTAEQLRPRLRNAFLADPINKAARAFICGKPWNGDIPGYGAGSAMAVRVLRDAVKEAGL